MKWLTVMLALLVVTEAQAQQMCTYHDRYESRQIYRPCDRQRHRWDDYPSPDSWRRDRNYEWRWGYPWMENCRRNPERCERY